MGSLTRKAVRAKYKAARGDTRTKRAQRGAVHAAKASRKSRDAGVNPVFAAAAREYLAEQGTEEGKEA